MPETRTARACWTSCAVALCSAVCAAALAQAPGPRIALRWSAPSECPSSSAVSGEVDRILGERGARPAKPLEVNATVTGTAGSYRVRVETAGSDGPRVRIIEGRSCAAIADATALIIALVIDPTVVPPEPVRPSPPETAASPTPPTPPAPPTAPAPPATSSAAPRPSAPAPTTTVAAPTPPPLPPRTPAAARTPLFRSFRVAGWAGADVGSLPGVAPGFGIEAAAILGAFRLELGGELYPDRHALVAKGSPFGGDVGLVAGYGGVCYKPLATPTFELGPCAEMELGRLHATGAGADHTTSGASLWAAPRAGVLFGVFPLSFLGLRVHAAAAFPLERPEFVLDNVPGRVVHQPGPVAGRLEWGVEARF